MRRRSSTSELKPGIVLARIEADAVQLVALLAKEAFGLEDCADATVLDERETGVVTEADAENAQERVLTTSIQHGLGARWV